MSQFFPPPGPLSRRQVLPGLGATVALPLLHAISPVYAAEQSSAAPRKLRIVVTGGHPGDPEYGCGGTVARYTEMGHEVVLLYLNRGDTKETATRPADPLRGDEGKKACEILGARPAFAGQINAHAIVDEEHYRQFRVLLEAEKPDAVFTHWPIDNHADHRAISNLTYDAWLRLGKKFALYYYEVSNGEDTLQFAPTHYVDITKTESRKRQSCYAHASQTPDRYYALQELVTRMRGIESGFKQAEAYVRHIQSPDFPLPPPA